MPRHCYPCAILLLCLLTAALSGCGKKSWPSPKAGEDRFAFQEIQGEAVEGCLNIEARMSGKHQNLRELVLEIEAKEEPCPGCPFSPTETVELPLSSAKIARNGPILSITWCGLKPGMAYRWRLKGVNVYPSIQDAVSEVKRLE